MAAIDWDDVTAWAPEMSGVAADAQTVILAYVNALSYDSTIALAEAATLAKILMAAHLGSSSLGANSAGPVISESEGGLSRSYAMIATSTGLGRTSYGQELKALLRRHCGGPFVV